MKKMIRLTASILSMFIITSCKFNLVSITDKPTKNDIIEDNNPASSSDEIDNTPTNDKTNNTEENNDTIEENKRDSLGTWWWSKSLDIDEYLGFAKENLVTEIYFCDYHITEASKALLEKASKENIKVYLLLGEKEWLNDCTNLDSLITKYITYQETASYKFSGIHLDVEPHQFSDFKDNRKDYLYKLINLVKTNKEKYSDIEFSYDIPFWLDDEIEYQNETKACYKHIIDFADRVFIMSYRDKADKMLNVSIDEINYAKEQNKSEINFTLRG